jgi:hypothetical protein
MKTTLKNLSDKELVTRLRQLVGKEKSITLEILPHLIEVGRRGLYLQKGYGSLYDYCKGELGYSDASAWRRVNAAESVRRFPEAYALLECGRVNLCTLGKISKVITRELLHQICDKSQAEVDLILAAHNPKKAIRDQMRPVTVFRPVKAGDALRPGARLKSAGAQLPAATPLPIRSEVRREEDPVETFEQVQVWDVRFAGDQELRELTEWMKSHLSSKYPKGVGLLETYKYALGYVREREDPARRAEMRAAGRTPPVISGSYAPNTIDTQRQKCMAGSTWLSTQCINKSEYYINPVRLRMIHSALSKPSMRRNKSKLVRRVTSAMDCVCRGSRSMSRTRSATVEGA